MPTMNERLIGLAIGLTLAVALTALLVAFQSRGLTEHWRRYVDGLPEREHGSN